MDAKVGMVWVWQRLDLRCRFIKRLCKAGANVNVRDTSGLTPFQRARRTDMDIAIALTSQKLGAAFDQDEWKLWEARHQELMASRTHGSAQYACMRTRELPCT